MTAVLIVTEKELRRHVPLDLDAVDCVEQALASLADPDVVMPPILHMAIERFNGEVDVKTAYVPGFDSFAIKISPGFFDNPKLGLPSLNGLMVLFNAKTGLIETLLLDNGYLTDVRTAAAGAVAARHLSREDASVAGVLGGGTQARLQLEALCMVRTIRQARLWARRPEQARAAAAELSSQLGIEVIAVEDPRGAVEGSDVVVTATPSRTPLVESDWLSPGMHITAMGSDSDYKNELAPGVLVRADRYLCDRRSQCASLGELHHAIRAGLIDADAHVDELAEVITGRVTGRQSPRDITVADLTGTGVQDTGIAVLAYRRCVAAGAGTEFES